MKYIEIIADSGSTDTIQAIASKAKAQDFRPGVVGEDGLCQMRILVSDNNLQSILDDLQSILSTQPKAHIVVLPVETALPKADEAERKEEDSAITAREALYDSVEKGAHLDVNFLVLTFLSTIVAGIGLIENNAAILIGAMVIAPLLGPNLALSLGTALGDIYLVKNAAFTLLRGILLAVFISYLLGMLWPANPDSFELISRTDAGFDSIVLALASGAAAALSLTTGLSSILVGVMVAVALLPPAAALGIMLGKGNLELALGAGLLLFVNIVCVNLASKVVFAIKGIRPRTWYEKEKAKRSMVVYIVGWIVMLAILTLFIIFRDALPT